MLETSLFKYIWIEYEKYFIPLILQKDDQSKTIF